MSDLQPFRHLVQEAAKEPVPQVDWDRIEQRLFEQIEREPIVLSSRRPAVWRPLVTVAAVAAGLAAAACFAITHHPSSDRALARNVDQHPVVSQPDVSLSAGNIDASSLHKGDLVLASAGALVVHHPGHATWTLSNSSSAVVEQLGSVIVLDLQSGSVRVDVVPRPDTESFVVRVGETAVSVHGTVFTVERRGDRAVVFVQRGSVAVGPRSRRGQGLGWMMVAPSGGEFSLDGARSASFQSPDYPVHASGGAQSASLSQARSPGSNLGALVEPSREPSAPGRLALQRSAQVAAASPPQAAPSPELAAPVAAELADKLDDALARATLDSIRAQIVDCHRRNHSAASGDVVKVTVESMLTLSVAPDGHMTMGRFDPPLAPAVQACASPVLLSAAFPVTKNASTLQLRLRF